MPDGSFSLKLVQDVEATQSLHYSKWCQVTQAAKYTLIILFNILLYDLCLCVPFSFTQ